jgi:hypothetical protein
MRCDRCGEDTRLERHEIDGFTGNLCEKCLEKWEDID